jgi:hypothetical protein
VVSVDRVRTELRRQPGDLVVLDRSDVDDLLLLLARLEVMLASAYERNPSFDKYRQIKQWTSSYTVRER